MTVVSSAAPMSLERIRDYWESKTFKYDCVHDRLRVIVEQVVRCNPGRVLDVGCSTGKLGDVLAEVLPDVEYYGCELSQTAVERIGRPTVIQWDLNTDGVPFAGSRFDCVVASGICEYMADLPGFLAGLHERLVPGGTLIVTYVNTRGIRQLGRRLLGRRPARNPTWQQIFSLEGFRRQLVACGFQVDRQLITSGHIREARRGSSSQWSAVWRRRCARFQLLTSLLAPQVVYVCRPEA